MKKAGILIILLMISVAFVWVSAYSQEEEELLRIDNSDFENPKRVASLFDHEEHFEIVGEEECNMCHHLFEDGIKVEDETSEDQRCVECHGLESSDDMPALMKSYHLRCKGCHVTSEAGPVMCGECHMK
jgi:hypothetical protein